MLTAASKFTIGPDKSKRGFIDMRYFENIEKKHIEDEVDKKCPFKVYYFGENVQIIENQDSKQ